MFNEVDFNLVKVVFQRELLLLREDRDNIRDLIKTDHPEGSDGKRIKVMLNASNEKEAISIAKKFKIHYKIESQSIPGVRKSAQYDRCARSFFLIFTEQDIKEVIKKTDYRLTQEMTESVREPAEEKLIPENAEPARKKMKL